MNVPLLCSGVLAIMIGAAHSLLGEKLLLGPLFRHGDVPRLLGSSVFARRTLRFAWHLTTILLVAIGGIVASLSFTELGQQTVWVLRALSLTFASCSLLSLVGARAKHFSWWVFLIIAILLWIGAR